MTRTTSKYCVGNEMDGPWQIGHLESVEYGRKALEAAKMMKWQDPSIKTVLCGSSNDVDANLPRMGSASLEIAWEKVDYHSIHYYVGNWDGDSQLAWHCPSNWKIMDTVASTLRYVKAKNRPLMMSIFRGMNGKVWYKDRTGRATDGSAPSERGNHDLGRCAARGAMAQRLPAQE